MPERSQGGGMRRGGIQSQVGVHDAVPGDYTPFRSTGTPWSSQTNKGPRRAPSGSRQGHAD